MFRLGPDFGATETGSSFYNLPPGQSLCPYHYEWAEEEWLLVVEGRPTLRHPGGEDVLEPMELLFFEIGPKGAHKLTNNTDENVRFLMFSTVRQPAVTVYPDSDKVGVYLSDKSENLIATRASNVDYYHGEPSVDGPMPSEA